jgi:hypothetical protein
MQELAACFAALQKPPGPEKETHLQAVMLTSASPEVWRKCDLELARLRGLEEKPACEADVIPIGY